MEDAHNVKINEHENLAVFGVFDGHGGKNCSQYLADHLPKLIFHRLNKLAHGLHHKETNQLDIKKVFDILRNSFFKVDHDLSHQPNLMNQGSTGIIATILDNYIIVTNTGDSRCILSKSGVAKTLSFDHKPSNMGERVRIENSNGYILNNRINEVLALSRAFGDFKFKLPYLSSSRNKYIIENQKLLNDKLITLPPELFQVTVEPEIMMYDMSALEVPEFIVLACDGIWDCFKNDQLIKIIRDKLCLGWKLNKIVEYILNDSLTMANNFTGIGFDNMTLIIIAIHNKEGQTIEDWYEMMSSKVLKEKGL
ncbi:PTC4 Protein phosphatase 2C 4 [Candida maltosa Xu316]